MSLFALQSAITTPSEDVICQDWRAIFATYRRAAEVYSRAVADAAGVSPAGLGAAWHGAEKARQNCENIRAELLDHEHSHGCFVSPSEACAPKPVSRSFRR